MVLGTLVTLYLPDLATIGLAFLLFKHLDGYKNQIPSPLTPLYYREKYGKTFCFSQMIPLSHHMNVKRGMQDLQLDYNRLKEYKVA